jgi:2-succinyl-5-enolpyruvyl-6-hydroxy-3-cyclohexene-1-carboxylate synthase
MGMLSTKLDFIVQLLWEAGISNWVISPGSRNAPIVASLIKHGQFNLISSPDERSGAFIALGISQNNQYPSGFICTSGSALVNAFPAVVEAYYQRIPWVILSADRPEELIDQWDGQTLRQPGIFGSYVRSSWYGNPRNETTANLAQGIYKCLQQGLTQIPAAIHLNISLSEPIYEGIDAPLEKSDSIPPFVYPTPQPDKVDLNAVKQLIFGKNFSPTTSTDHKNRDLVEYNNSDKDHGNNFSPTTSTDHKNRDLVEYNNSDKDHGQNIKKHPTPPNKQPKIAILVGQNPPSPLLKSVLNELQNYIPVFTDVCSSQTQVGLNFWDWGMLKRDIPQNLEPELLISLGTATLSKPLKQFLKKSQPKHIHVGLHHEVGDPFETKPEHWKVNEADFLQAILELFASTQTHLESEELESKITTVFSKQHLYDWQQFIKSQTLVPNELPQPFAKELQFMQKLFQSATENCNFHLGNSMSVRYGSWSGHTKAQVYSNRGVSGIDGCLSTAVGAAIASPEKTHVVVLGDVSTMYDSNALWTALPSNLNIVVYNNGGGRIFDWIDGPNKIPELRNFIHTPRTFNLEYLCKLFDVPHFKYSLNQMDEVIPLILNDSLNSMDTLDSESSKKTVRFFELIS